MAMMKAIRFDGDSVALATVSRPSVQGEALVRVTAVGVCNKNKYDEENIISSNAYGCCL